MMWQRPWLGVVAGFLGAFGAATCDRREPRAEPLCPPCECTCPAAPAAVETPAPKQDPALAAAPTPAAVPDIGEAVAVATRKMMHDDGAGCLADLDRVAAIDPKLEARLAVTRGQCEMLVGRCQAGKARVARWYVDETNMHPERAALTAESIAAMRCRDGDSTDRDRLLRAFHELSDGAYMNKKTAAACKAQLEVARALIPKVPPRGPDDTQISGGAQALFHTAATCFAHADDCSAAWSAYRTLFPSAGLAAVPDPAERDKVIASSFDTTITRCIGKR